MSKRKNIIPKGFKAFRMTNGDAVLVHTRTQNCGYCYFSNGSKVQTNAPIDSIPRNGWPLPFLEEGERITHQIVE